MSFLTWREICSDARFCLNTKKPRIDKLLTDHVKFYINFISFIHKHRRKGSLNHVNIKFIATPLSNTDLNKVTDNIWNLVRTHKSLFEYKSLIWYKSLSFSLKKIRKANEWSSCHWQIVSNLMLIYNFSPYTWSEELIGKKIKDKIKWVTNSKSLRNILNKDFKVIEKIPQ